MIESLKDIPRIGEKIARRFIEHFGSEKKALDAILNGDITGISEVEGMTRNSSISLVLEAFFKNEGVSARDFLRTDEAYGVYERVLEIISHHANTDHARSKLHLYFPYPSSRRDRIIKIQSDIRSAMEITARLDGENISELLTKIHPVKTNFKIPAIRDRVIIATTQEEFEAAGDFPVSVHLISDPREVVDVARGYSHVIISAGFAGMDLPEEIDFDFLDITKAETWQVAPEKVLAFFSRNRDSIISAIEVTGIIRKHAPAFCECVPDAEMERLAAGLNRISKDMDLKSGTDSEIDRCRDILRRLDEVTAGAEKKANIEFGSLIEKSSVTIKGFDLLAAINGGINRLLEKEIREKYNTVTGEAVQTISTELKLTPLESQFVSNFFGDEVTHPIKVNPKGVENLKNHLQRSITSKKLALLREYARDLSPLKESASALVREVLDFDVKYTLGRFARVYGLTLPEIQEENGIGIREGANLFLKEPVPINYTVGVSRFNEGIPELKDSKVTLLSGVNSGGKTSTLELIAQTVILAHMGFPVPAKHCEMGLVDEFYYFGKSKGTMDAGAFESTLKDFSVVANKKKKIVLADEMESITEPGAAARIISGILEELDDNNGLGVFVSHLAESILKNTAHSIRVDGIEAKGLDEDLNLIVDRNPRYNYLARSTPELIVERLARKNQSMEFYGRLLRKFR